MQFVYFSGLSVALTMRRSDIENSSEEQRKKVAQMSQAYL